MSFRESLTDLAGVKIFKPDSNLNHPTVMKVNYNKQISVDFEPLRFHSEKKQSALAEKVLKMNSYAFK